ncbi:MAG: hypothetical protein CL912_04745 [Deltaproteobacteria bacterium]|nr:hypothetical protein [Deltaproteobacteria bacterium]
MLGKPKWQGFFPGKREVESIAGTDLPRNRFQRVVFPSYVPQGLKHWAQVTELSNLRCLDLPWDLKNASALAEIAAKGEAPSLQRLRLCSEDSYGNDDETEESQAAMDLLLSTLNPLHRLEIAGYISPRTFDVLVDHHGENLRYLALKPSREEISDDRNPLVVFSAPVIHRFAARCSHLTHLSIPINRTRGDKYEVGIYRALNKLPSLQYLSLQLMYSVGPEKQFWDEEKDGEYRLSLEFTEGDADRIPMAYLQETFSNGIDEVLAREIFSLISGINPISRNVSSKLRYLRLEPIRKIGWNAPAV